MDNDIITNLQIKQIQATLNSQEYKTAIQKTSQSFSKKWFFDGLCQN